MSKSEAAGGRRRTVLRLATVVFSVLAAALLIGLVDAWAALGTKPASARLERLRSSKQYRDGKFVDTIPRVDPDIWVATRRWLKGVPDSRPTAPLPVVHHGPKRYSAAPASGLRITWYGHSSLLVELEGRRVLLDPIWSERCSPSSFIGPKRFHPPPIPLASLPPIDAVLISHDHYDHLDHATILALAQSGTTFVVPLGVGAHLEYWGIEAARIHELDWWQEARVAGLNIVATPARHFSGRGLGADLTLWAGWAVIGEKRRVYYSGDTAMFEGFREIGARLGPFDASMIEVGAYDALWADVHLGPEQAVQANRDVRGGVLFPVHWGTFDLALHSWVEPAERVLAAARAAGVSVVTPRPGESIDPLASPAPAKWWPGIPWKTAADSPVVSSGLPASSDLGPRNPI